LEARACISSIVIGSHAEKRNYSRSESGNSDASDSRILFHD
jgi:hypothetical protein